MEATIDSIFTLRFHGNEIAPSSFTAKELGELLVSIDEGLKSIIEEKFPEIEVEDCRTSLVGIENKSESLQFEAINTIPAFLNLSESIVQKTYTNQPKKAYDTVVKIHQIVEEKKCNLDVVYKGAVLHVVLPNTTIVKQESVIIDSDTTLYGEVIKIGSQKSFKENTSKPKIWVQLTSGQKICFGISVQQALQLSPQLSKTVGFKGNAKWNMITKNVHSFKLYDITGFKSGRVSEGFERIRALTSGYWDTLNSNEEITNYLKCD